MTKHVALLLLLIYSTTSNYIFCAGSSDITSMYLEKVLKAQQEKDTQTIKKIIQLDSLSNRGRLLLSAINTNNLKLGRLLLEHGANPNGSADKQDIPLMLAANIGATSFIDLLIAYKAQPNFLDIDHVNALFAAVCTNQIACAEKLIKAGINLDTQDKKNYTALMVACHFGYIQTTQLLIKYNANVHFTADNQQSALHMAVLGNNNACIEAMLKTDTPVNAQDLDGDTPLHLACHTGNKRAVELLLNYGADPTIANNMRQKPIQVTKLSAIKKMLRQAKKQHTLKKIDKSEEKTAPSKKKKKQDKKKHKPTFLANAKKKFETGKTFFVTGAKAVASVIQKEAPAIPRVLIDPTAFAQQAQHVTYKKRKQLTYDDDPLTIHALNNDLLPHTITLYPIVKEAGFEQFSVSEQPDMRTLYTDQIRQRLNFIDTMLISGKEDIILKKMGDAQKNIPTKIDINHLFSEQVDKNIQRFGLKVPIDSEPEPCYQIFIPGQITDKNSNQSIRGFFEYTFIEDNVHMSLGRCKHRFFRPIDQRSKNLPEILRQAFINYKN